MKILVKENNSYFFRIENRNVKPEELCREDLMWLLNEIYHSSNQGSVVLPEKSDINEISNPVEREIVQQIINKISEFKNNVDNIKKEIEYKFPEIDSQ